MRHFIFFITRYGYQAQAVFFSGLMVMGWNIERAAGAIFNYRKWKHALGNSLFIFTNFPGQFLMGLFFVQTIRWTGFHHFGLLYSMHVRNPLLLFLASFVLLDLGEYIYHVIMHKVKRLWMFHLVHHSDRVVDVSTTFREHPGENLIRLSFTLLWVFLSGAVIWVLILRQIIQVFSTLFAHINYRLPQKIDRIVGLVFITPNLHQVHHHYQQPYTDCNYGDVLSVWDRLFGTFKQKPAQELVFGVDTYMSPDETDNIFSLINIPFGKYRAGKKPSRDI